MKHIILRNDPAWYKNECPVCGALKDKMCQEIGKRMHILQQPHSERILDEAEKNER